MVTLKVQPMRIDRFYLQDTHRLRCSANMRLGEVPGSVVMPPMLEE